MSQLTAQELQISKSISYYLRHRPDELGIALDMDGWTSLDVFLKLLSAELASEITLATINYIMENSAKQRFEINLANNLIRAKYGHSVDIKPDYPILTESITLYHGTATSNIPSILESGLISQSRQYVHLTSDYNLAVLTAKRWSTEITIITVLTSKILEAGQNIYAAGQGIYLVDHVDAKYLQV
jgi:putative RNA 2'-phosphotransferase